ncbi:MAG TPA: hypothetical protein PLB41_07095 [Rubrivivax sp.]|nr:hypothetical protein [Rubrivivax sp.]
MADLIPIKLTGRVDAPALPALLSGASRTAGASGDDFLPPGYLRPTGSFDVGGAARSVEGAAALQHEAAADEVVVLELADGGTLVTSAERLRDALARSHPDWLGPHDPIPFEKLRAEAATAQRVVRPSTRCSTISWCCPSMPPPRAPTPPSAWPARNARAMRWTS